MLLTSRRTHINKLRARLGNGADRLSWQSRLQLTLGSLDFRAAPSGDAILCVRRLADPLPGKVPRDGGPPSPAWREAVSESLRMSAAHAARPVRELVGANANAVLFADVAELLACLARDSCLGDAHRQWWWKMLFPDQDLPRAAVSAWIEHPQHVPTALRRLNAANCAAEFLTTLPRAAVGQMLEHVIITFALQQLRHTPTIASGASLLDGER